MSARNTFIIGHSYVPRLGNFCAEFSPKDFFKLHHACEVKLFGRGGLKISQLDDFTNTLPWQLEPSVVILVIGTNDVSRDLTQTPVQLARELLSFANSLIVKREVKKVFICEILNLKTKGYQILNERVRELNKLLSQELMNNTQITFWKLRKMNILAKNLLLPDGVHLNDAGQFLLWRNLRGAIKISLKKSLTT